MRRRTGRFKAPGANQECPEILCSAGQGFSFLFMEKSWGVLLHRPDWLAGRVLVARRPPSMDMPTKRESRIKPSRLEPETVVLLRRIQEGDRDAERALFERYLPRVRQIVALRMHRAVSSLADLEDVVQDSLRRAFRRVGSFEERSEGSFRDYLSACVTGSIRDAIKQFKAKKNPESRTFSPSPHDLEKLVFSSAETPSAVAIANELAERIEAALLDMDEQKRELIVMSRLCGMSYEEIAAKLGVRRPATLRVYLSRALRELEARVLD